MSATAPRGKAFLLAVPEQRLLEAIARRLPPAVRPDHLTSLAPAAAAATALVGPGLGLSPQMHFAVALLLVIAYLALSIKAYLETQALGRFTLGYGRLGPTEARLLLLGALAAVALGAHASVAVAGRSLTLLDLAGGGGALVMLAAGAVRAAGNLRTLARRERYGVR